MTTSEQLLLLRLAHEPPDIAVIAALGEIDMSNSGDLERMLDSIDGDNITVDLTHCTFIDSSCLAVLIRHATRVRDGGKQFSVLANRDGRRIIEMTNLQDHLGLTDQNLSA